MSFIDMLDSFFRLFLNLPADVEFFWLIVKLFFILAFILYFLFAIIVVRQVFMMTKTFKTSAEFVLKTFSIIHLFFAVGLLVASYLIL